MEPLRRSLEPYWKSTTDFTLIDTLADVVIWDGNQQRHLLRSAIDRKFFTFTGQIDKGAVAITILQGQFLHIEKGFKITTVEGTKVWSHMTPSLDSLSVVIETCSGIGALGEGLEENGFRIALRNELRPRLCQLMQQQGFQQTVEGDIGLHSTIEAIVRLHPGSTMWAAGFPCQPWSWLGDNKGSKDERATTLKSILIACFFCRAHTILLECVVGASKDKETMEIIKEWVKLTGFNFNDCKLELHQVWPSKRSRWWCLLTFPGTPKFSLEEFPVLPKPPVVNDVLPVFPSWPEDEMRALILGVYETKMFEDHGGISTNVIDLHQPLQTALHAWGSQLDPCPCGCRMYPLSLGRLQQKGLHGALLPIKGTFNWNNQEWPNLRHIHPWELALLVGLKPHKFWQGDIKLSLVAVGQLASPLQSGWVVSQMKYHMHDLFHEDRVTPESVLWNMMENLFRERDEHFDGCVNIPQVQEFMISTKAYLSAKSQTRTIPEPIVTRIGEKTEPKQEDAFEAPLIHHSQVQGQSSQEHRKTPLSDILTKACSTRESAVSNTIAVGITPVDLTGPTQEAEWREVEEKLRAYHAAQPETETYKWDVNEKRRWQEVGCIPGFFTKPPGVVTIDQQIAQGPVVTSDEAGTVTANKEDERGSLDAPGNVEDATWDINMGAPNLAVQKNGSDERDQATLTVTIAIYPFQTIHSTKYCKRTSIYEILCAERAVGSIPNDWIPTNVLGTILDFDEAICNHNIILIQPAFNNRGITNHCSLSDLEQVHWNRVTLALHQGLWVAHDEMDHYLAILATELKCMWAPVCVVDPTPVLDESSNQIRQWFEEIAVVCPPDQWVASAFLDNGHWHPVLVSTSANRLRCTSSAFGHSFLKEHFPEIEAVMDISTSEVMQAEVGDCGFQSIAWLAKQKEKVHIDQAITIDEAVKYRLSFIGKCTADSPAKDTLPTKIHLGGMIPGSKHDSLEYQMQQLLETHGVPPSNSTQRASQIIDQLGRKTISQVLRSARAWKDLKAQANLSVPKIQLVLPGELEQVIQNRIKEGTPFGRHKQKKPGQTNQKGIIQLQPDDICIPHGVFRSGSSQPIAQIAKTKIGSEASGIVVMTSIEASPYIKLNKPVSTQGLAMLVLDYENVSLHGQGQIIRFPATCNKTNEPMLISGRLIQIGSVEISRNEPSQKLKVEEEDTKVVRILAYRDEVESSMQWQDFVAQPVKHIIQMTPELQQGDQQIVLDVWDRQWVNSKLDKVRQTDAQIFIVTIRILSTDLQPLLSKSGQQGLYYEPRAADGRSPCPSYRVLWLTKSDRENVNIAIQTSKHWACIVRSGLRVGIRTLEKDAAALHQTHRPDTPFLDVAQPKQFAVGPFPCGSTKGSLSKIFSKWGWEARPLQPRARASDGTGIIWTVLAGQSPECEIYQLHHGDVLVSEITAKKNEIQGPKHGVFASAKTIAALHEPKKEQTDPWHVHGDPWQQWNQNKSQRTQETHSLSQQQVQQIESNLEKKIQARLDKTDRDDTNMQIDETERIVTLEERLSNFERQVQATALHQQKQHEELKQQVGGLQKQIEVTNTNINQVLDQRFEEQLSQIERLLSKKPRQE